MAIERDCTPAEAETAARLRAVLSSDRELPFYRILVESCGLGSRISETVLLRHAHKHAHRSGWGGIMFKSEFWRWPDIGDFEPLEPDAPMRDRLEAWRRQWARELKRKKPGARQAEATA